MKTRVGTRVRGDLGEFVLKWGAGDKVVAHGIKEDKMGYR